MAAVQPGAQGFDPKAFYSAAVAQLPLHARPVFVRVTPSLETTGTMKFRKGEWQKAGYGRDLPDTDALYVRVDAEGCYAPLTESRRADLKAGRLRI